MMEFIASIWTAFRAMVPTLSGQIMLALGLAVGTTSGLTVLLDWAKQLLLTSISGLPAEVVGLMASMKIGICISMLFGALSARMFLKGMSPGGILKRLIWT